MVNTPARTVEDILKSIIGDQAVFIARLQVAVEQLPSLHAELEELRSQLTALQAPPAPPEER